MLNAVKMVFVSKAAVSGLRRRVRTRIHAPMASYAILSTVDAYRARIIRNVVQESAAGKVESVSPVNVTMGKHGVRKKAL